MAQFIALMRATSSSGGIASYQTSSEAGSQPYDHQETGEGGTALKIDPHRTYRYCKNPAARALDQPAGCDPGLRRGWNFQIADQNAGEPANVPAVKGGVPL